ncbi:hypothetical protein FPQ18DRAFT_375366 [Pyronema domesticum]|nr:hypothetical protein FPQ18DRAFT_375366 [Pyronema domesticum]
MAHNPEHRDAYWTTSESYTKYGHWCDPHEKVRRRHPRNRFMGREFMKTTRAEFCAIKEMIETGEICCKGHENLAVAQEVMEKNIGKREQEKQEAKERDSWSMAIGKEKEEVNGRDSAEMADGGEEEKRVLSV